MRHNRGFTMAEALTVMGIIVVLAAAAVPSGMGAMKNVRQIQLNRSAETIYMTAQLNLIAAKVSGKSSVSETITSRMNDTVLNKQIVLPANSISPALYAGNWAIVCNGWTVETAYYSESETWSDSAGFAAWQAMASDGAGKVGKYGA